MSLSHVSCRLIDYFGSQDLRTQAMQERDNVRHISLQRDIELKELQSRVDRAVCQSPPFSIAILSCVSGAGTLQDPRIPRRR